jgi:hypothetical protein
LRFYFTLPIKQFSPQLITFGFQFPLAFLSVQLFFLCRGSRGGTANFFDFSVDIP